MHNVEVSLDKFVFGNCGCFWLCRLLIEMASKVEPLDPAVIQKTRDTLGKIITKPPLTDKLLSRPPFRYLHDIVTEVIRTTGFLEGLYSAEELNVNNIQDKEQKLKFLQKAVDAVSKLVSNVAHLCFISL